MKHIIKTNLWKGVFMALIFGTLSFSANAQTATVHNDLGFDIDLEVFGVSSSCTSTSQSHTATQGVSVVTLPSGVDYWVGASVIGTSCNSSTTVQDYSDSPCSGTNTTTSTFTAYQGPPCYYAVDKTIVIEIVVAGTDCEITIYEQ